MLCVLVRLQACVCFRVRVFWVFVGVCGAFVCLCLLFVCVCVCGVAHCFGICVCACLYECVGGGHVMRVLKCCGFWPPRMVITLCNALRPGGTTCPACQAAPFRVAARALFQRGLF